MTVAVPLSDLRHVKKKNIKNFKKMLVLLYALVKRFIVYCMRHFHQLGPLGRVGLVVTESVCLCVCLCLCLCLFFPFPCNFFRGLSLVLRSHDQIPASHWSTLLPYHTVVVVVTVGWGGFMVNILLLTKKNVDDCLGYPDIFITDRN